MIFYGFYLDFYDLFKDVQVIQDILRLGKQQRLNKTLKMWSAAIFQKWQTTELESVLNISRFVWNRYLKVLEFLSFKLNILCSILFHVKFVRLTTKYTLTAYIEYYVYYTIWMWKVEIVFWYIILSFKLKTSYFCQIGAVIQVYVQQCVKLTTCPHASCW